MFDLVYEVFLSLYVWFFVVWRRVVEDFSWVSEEGLVEVMDDGGVFEVGGYG